MQTKIGHRIVKKKFNLYDVYQRDASGISTKTSDTAIGITLKPA